MTETFDGVSVGNQTRKDCVLYLQLSAMKTTKGVLGKHKPTNADIPKPVVTDDEVIVTADINVDGSPKTYKWTKNHGGKISKCDIKVEAQQLKVTLTKSQAQDWIGEYLEYLQEI